MLCLPRMGEDSVQSEVTVIGGGLAGLGVSLHLAKAGFLVACIEPDADLTKVVGESLDWSAPDLLRAVGLTMDHLIGERAATYKKHVTLKLGTGCDRNYVPSDWLGRPPFNVELKTLHVDRVRLDEELRRKVLEHGVKLYQDKVTQVEADGRRVLAANTAGGRRFTSQWFVDASGSGTVLPRLFQLPVDEYGPRKVAMWTHFAVPESSEGTTLYADGANPPYLNWTWEIPIRPDAISVGYVATGDTIKAQRQRGRSNESIFRSQLALFPRFQEFLETHSVISPFVTSFQCRVHRGVAGPNWLVIGESASMVDPMTSNGVTAALRHAEEAAELLVRSRHREQLPRVASAMYCRRVRDLGRFFNSGIENVIYEWPIRSRIGPLAAGDVYTVPAWSLNHLYTRFRPRGVVGTFLFGFVLRALRASCEIYAAFSRRRSAACEAAA